MQTSNCETDFQREETIVLRSIMLSELWVACRETIDHRVLEVAARAAKATSPGHIALVMGESDETLLIWERTVDRFVSLKTGKARP